MFFEPSKSRKRAKTANMVVYKTSDLFQIKIKITNPSQEPSASSKAPNEDKKDIYVLCPFKIKIESKHLDHGCIKDQWPCPNQDKDAKPQSGTFQHSPKPPKRLKGHGCSLHLQHQSQNLKHDGIKDNWPYPNQDKYTKHQSGTPSIFHIPKSRLCFGT